MYSTASTDMSVPAFDNAWLIAKLIANISWHPPNAIDEVSDPPQFETIWAGTDPVGHAPVVWTASFGFA